MFIAYYDGDNCMHVPSPSSFFLFVLSEASFDGVSPKTDNKNSNYHFHADIEYHHPYMSFHKSRSCALSSIRLKITVKSKSPRRSHFESVTT